MTHEILFFLVIFKNCIKLFLIYKITLVKNIKLVLISLHIILLSTHISLRLILPLFNSLIVISSKKTKHKKSFYLSTYFIEGYIF